MFEGVLNVLRENVRGRTMKWIAQEIFSRDVWSSYDKYHETAEFCLSFLKEAGLVDAKIIPEPADGKTVCGTFISPLAWDARKGFLTIVAPESEAGKVLADYRERPHSLIRWSSPTKKGGEIFDVVRIKDGTKEDEYRKTDCRGKIIYTESLATKAKPLAAKYGARGIISAYNLPRRVYVVGPKGIYWQNVWHDRTNWGPTDGDDSRLFGFAVDKLTQDYLDDLFAKGKRIRVRAEIDARLYKGTFDTITATIRGTEKPLEEVIILGHLYEATAADNASGGAVILELARVLSELIGAGKLPRPRRTIRFLLSWEWIGFVKWAQDHPEICRKAKLAICLDTVAFSQKFSHLPFQVVRNAEVSSAYTDVLAPAIFAKCADGQESDFKWRVAKFQLGTDTFFCDPMIGIPMTYYYSPEGEYWHSSENTIDMLDEEMFRRVACAAGCEAYFVANAGKDEARYLVELMLSSARSELSHEADAWIGRFFAPYDGRTLDMLKEEFERKFDYLVPVKRRYISSCLSLAPRSKSLSQKVRSALSDYDAFASSERKRALAAWKSAPPKKLPRGVDPPFRRRRLLQWSRLAERLIPERVYFGPIFCYVLARSESDLKLLEQGSEFRNSIFWVDGRRTLKEVLENDAMQRDTYLDSYNEATAFRFYRALAKAGLIRMKEKGKALTKEKLLSDLRRLGVRSGDVLLVHSSVRAVGPVKGGAETIIDALQASVGPKGTLCMPAFSFATARDGKPFHPKKSKVVVGTLPDLFWRMPGVIRSAHPSHGIAARGPLAEFITKDHELYSPYAREGAFGKLYEADAKILMLGCTLAPNSTFHAIEDWADFKDSMQPDDYLVEDDEGNVRTVRYEKEPVLDHDFYKAGWREVKIERILRKRNAIREGVVGFADCYLMRTRDVMDVGLAAVKKYGNIL